MRLISDMIGEYIYCTKSMYPNCIIFYKDKKVQKHTETNDLNNQINSLCKQLKCEDSDYAKYVLKNIDEIEEVVFNKNGLIRFSVKVKNG